MTTCAEQTERISLFLDGLLPPEEAGALHQHVQRCPHCRRTAATMQRIDTLFRRSPLVQPPPGFTQRTVARALARQQRDNLLFGGISLLFGTILMGALVLTTTVGASGVAWALLGAPVTLAQSPDILGSISTTLTTLGRAAWEFLLAVRQIVSHPLVAMTLLFLMVGGIGLIARFMRSSTQPAANLT